MQLIEEYILKSKEDRQRHLKLDEPCLERGGNSTTSRGMLAHIHDTTIPKYMLATLAIMDYAATPIICIGERPEKMF